MNIPFLILALATAQVAGPQVSQASGPGAAAAEVFLDHLYVVVDSATYEAIKASAFPRDGLAMFGERTNRSGAESWTALGVGGERTYLEIFGVGERYPRVGTSGIAFSVGAPGELDTLASQLGERPDLTVHRSVRTGVMGGREMAWFQSLRVEHGSVPDPGLSRWVMEYERPFRAALMGDSADAITGPDVRRWLRARRYDPTRPLRDITGVVIAMDPDDAAAFRTELESYGFPVAADRVGYRAAGHDLEIRVVVSTARPGIRALWLRLEGVDMEALEPVEHVFAGGSTLRIVDDTTAVWMFDPGAAGASDSLTVLRDVSYVAGGHERQALDLYLPPGRGAPPVVLYVHGGGWSKGDKGDYAHELTPFDLVREGWAVAALNYRLSQQATFPAQVEDLEAALRWLRANADHYQLDAGRIAAVGFSAGGHLAALLGTRWNAVMAEVGARGARGKARSRGLAGVVAYYSPIDFLAMGDQLAAMGLAYNPLREEQLLGGSLAESRALAARANPVTYLDEQDPPTLLVHGDADPLVPHAQSEIFRDALARAGVPVTLYTVRRGEHGDLRMDPGAREVALMFLRRWLDPEDAP